MASYIANWNSIPQKLCPVFVLSFTPPPPLPHPAFSLLLHIPVPSIYKQSNWLWQLKECSGWLFNWSWLVISHCISFLLLLMHAVRQQFPLQHLTALVALHSVNIPNVLSGVCRKPPDDLIKFLTGGDSFNKAGIESIYSTGVGYIDSHVPHDPHHSMSQSLFELSGQEERLLPTWAGNDSTIAFFF